MTEKRWHLLPHDEIATNALAKELSINKTICTVLTTRNITNYDMAKDFFRPSLQQLISPWLMKDMRKAVDRIAVAMEKKEKLLVFGDYDVDGTTAVASFYQFICQLYQKEQVDFYIPNRYTEGYGISKKGIEFAAENNISLIICLDCGIKSAELIGYANSLGIDFIICDHHLPGDTLPDAVAILNPKQADCTYPYKDLCGCGIGFKFMMALAETFSLPATSYLCYLDLVATAIAADIVPMTGENRILAFHGLLAINEHPSPGIQALITLAGVRKKLTISNVVFIIAPRVNAAGRMDDAKKAVLLFIEQNPEKALEIGRLLQSDNTDRKEIDAAITEEALDMIQQDASILKQKACVLYQEHWHKGVVGIVASRVIEHHYKPTIILTKSEGVVTGSARSVKGFNLYEAIYACRDYLLHYGGHFAAAGLSMTEENVTPFTNQFYKVVSESIEDHMLIPEIVIDAVIDFNEINDSFYNIISQMEPFGPDNLNPVFMAKHVTDSGYSKLLKEKHIKFDLLQNHKKLSGIAFNMPEKYSLLKSGKPVDVVFTIDKNEFNGQANLQLMIIDFKLSS